MLRMVIAGALLSAGAADSWDWPQWRGPGRDAVSAARPGPLAWPEDLTRRWRAPVGLGQSSPVVAGDSVFVFGREEDREVARALDLGTGETLWRQSYPAPYTVYPGAASYGSGPKSTPVIDAERVFTLGIGGILSAFDRRDGRVVWQMDFAGRFAANAPPFGTAMSPLILDGTLIVHAGGHDGGALLALDPATGAERWALDGDGPSYSSPIVTTFGGQEQIVIQVHRRVLGVDPAMGRILWSLPFVTPCDQNIVTPLRAGDVIVVSSPDTGTKGIRPVRRRWGWTVEVVWRTSEVSMYMSSPVLANGRVIGLSQRKRGQFFALDPESGTVEWTSDPGQGENAALVRAEAAILVLQGDSTLLVLPEEGRAFAPIRRYRVGESPTYAHPVPTRRGILVRDEDGLGLYSLGGPRSNGGAP